MDVKKCPECGHEVLDHMDVCSYCGCPIKSRSLNASKTAMIDKLMQVTDKFFLFAKRNSRAISVVIAVLLIIVGLNNVGGFFENLFRVFDDIIDMFDYGLSVDTLDYFVFVIANLFGVAGYFGTAFILITKNHKEYLNFMPLLIGASYLISIIDLLLWILYGWFYIDIAIKSLLVICLGVLWIMTAYIANKSIDDYHKKKICSIIIVVSVVSLLFFTICNFALMLDKMPIGNFIRMILIFIVLALFAPIQYISFGNGDNKMDEPKVSKQDSDNRININNEYPVDVTNNYLKVWVLIVLSIVTLGIYSFIWIYRTVGFLNSKKIGEEQSQGIQVVLCLFVPFYIIYWLYKQSKLIEIYTLKVGNRSNDLSVITLILAVFGLSLVSIALMQDQINKNLIAENNGVTNDNLFIPVENTNVYRNNTVVTEKMAESIVTDVPAPNKDVLSNGDIEILKKIKELHDLGVLTEEEYETEKSKILKK